MNKKLIIRIIAAACFVPLLVANIQTLLFMHTFDVFKILPFGSAVASVAVSLLPSIVHLLIIAGALFKVPAVLGAGAVIMVIQNAVNLSTTIWPLAMNTHNYWTVIINILTVLAYLTLALAAFISKRGKLFGIIAAAFSLSRIIVYIVFKVKLTSPLGSFINIVCFAAGAVIVGMLFTEKARKKAAASRS